MASLRVERETETGKIKDLFPPLIAAQIDYLLRHSQLPIKVDQIYTGTKNSRYADRFSLLIPCCLDYVKWDVVYNCQYPMAAPDIIFGPDDERFQPLSATGEEQETYQSICRILCDWKIKDASGLLQLLLELRHLYMGYQRKRVEELDDPRLKFEISTIIPREGVEICLLSGADNLEEVKFAVRLVDLDLSKQVLGCLLRQQQQIFLQLSEAITSVNLRRAFVEALVPHFGRPLEAETVFCRRVSVLAATGPFTFLVHFILPIQFPKQQPTLTFQSSQHFDSQGMPITSRLYSDYPWSPRWDVSQMTQRIFEFVVDECINFKQYCSDALQFHR
ncbi:uncharacterized protein LOC131044746 isoform X2 [Cryptomeria japonica]|uniref:uncharacterized protein LOC131044746 isoform X2 n=1 Tax=Cryptomeria japonica TaxID=3369 RepID=UPI0025ACFC97|nr:uncharacterized protein LOC131044746 isoform X2 [Cryptomeria japonica]